MDFLGHPPQVLCDYCSVSLGDFRYERESVGREESLAGFTPSLQCFRLSLTSGEVPALEAPHRKCWGRDGRRSVWRRRCAGLPPSARVGLPQPPGTRRARLAPFWVIASRVGHCSWWRVGGGQGCCQPSCEAHGTPAPNRIALARSVHSAAVEKPTRWSMLSSNESPCFLFMCYMLVSSPEPCAPRHLELGLVCSLRSRCP